MMKVEVSEVKKLIRDFDESYVLIQGSEVAHVLESLGLKEEAEGVEALLVKVGEGEYLEVWKCPFIPYMMEYAFRLYPKGEEVED